MQEQAVSKFLLSLTTSLRHCNRIFRETLVPGDAGLVISLRVAV